MKILFSLLMISSLGFGQVWRHEFNTYGQNAVSDEPRERLVTEHLKFDQTAAISPEACFEIFNTAITNVQEKLDNKRTWVSGMIMSLSAENECRLVIWTVADPITERDVRVTKQYIAHQETKVLLGERINYQPVKAIMADITVGAGTFKNEFQVKPLFEMQGYQYMNNYGEFHKKMETAREVFKIETPKDEFLAYLQSIDKGQAGMIEQVLPQSNGVDSGFQPLLILPDNSVSASMMIYGATRDCRQTQTGFCG